MKTKNGTRKREVVDVVEGYYPAVITQDVWDEVQVTLKARQRTSRGGRPPALHNYLKGLLRNSEGSTWTSVNRSERSTRYYVPMSAKMSKVGTLTTVRQSLFERAFVAAFVSAYFARCVGHFSRGQTGNDRTELTTERERIERQEATIEEQLVNMSDPAPLLRVLDRLAKRRREVVGQLERMPKGGQTELDRLLLAQPKLIAFADGEQQNNDDRVEFGGLVRSLVSEVILDAATANDEMRGICRIVGHEGQKVMFQFAYSVRKGRQSAASRAETLSVDVVVDPDSGERLKLI